MKRFQFIHNTNIAGVQCYGSVLAKSSTEAKRIALETWGESARYLPREKRRKVGKQNAVERLLTQFFGS